MKSTIDIDKICEIIYSGKKIGVITGAGVSVASGISPFRDENGKCLIECMEEKLHIDYLRGFPKEFHKFYTTYFTKSNNGPNVTHVTLAELQEKGYIEGIITQNIDNLHTLAGSKNVIEMHGNGTSFSCTNPGCDGKYTKEQYNESDICPICGNLVRPDIVLYGESPEGIGPIFDLLKRVDLLLVLGSSIKVGDMKGLIIYYRSIKRDFNSKEDLILINLGETLYDNDALVCHIDLETAFKKIRKYGIENGYLDLPVEDKEKVLSIGEKII